MDFELLNTPDEIDAIYPITENMLKNVIDIRKQLTDILNGVDDRAVVVCGPCSIHDQTAALDYARRLKIHISSYSSTLLIIMRAYLQKPRTTVGWKGYLFDPEIKDRVDINKGIKESRKLLCELVSMGVPIADEVMTPSLGVYFDRLLAWAAVGARTVESQIHRNYCSTVPYPIGFKNSTSGDVQVALDAVVAARSPSPVIISNKQGQLGFVASKGNPWGHIILRGGKNGPNYYTENVQQVKYKMNDAKIIVDCSHGNSQKNHHNQSIVCEHVCEQIRGGEDAIVGLMLESHIKEGNQPCAFNESLEYGKSITDKCIDIETTGELLELISQAVLERRRKKLIHH